MDEMSGDEFFALLVSIVAFLMFAWRWITSIVTVEGMICPARIRSLLFAAPLAAFAALFIVLASWSAHDVRDSTVYFIFYMIMGGAWLGLVEKTIIFMGISARDDAIDNRNRAAAFAYFGALVGLMLCFAGGNIGDGPGWWVVLFSAGLATAGYLLMWLVFEKLSGLSERITVERDDSAGIRLAGFLLAVGIILGRSAAGNWVSAEATVHDFLNVAWPALPLMAVAVVVEKILPGRSIGIEGIFPAATYIGAAVGYVMWRGAW